MDISFTKTSETQFHCKCGLTTIYCGFALSTGSLRMNKKLYMLISQGCGALFRAQTGGKFLLMHENFENMDILEQYCF